MTTTSVHSLTYTAAGTGKVYWLNDNFFTHLDDEGGIDGIYGICAEPIITKLPLQEPPALYATSGFTERTITVKMTCFSGSNTRWSPTTWWGRFVADLRADALAGAPGVLTYMNEDRIIRAIKAVLSQDSVGIEWLGGHGIGSRGFAAQLTWKCADPTFYAPTLKTATGAFAGVANVNISCTNAGDVVAYPNILYDTDGAQTLQTPDVNWGATGSYTVLGTLAINTTLLTICELPWSVTYSGAPTDWSGLRYGGIPAIAIGTNNLGFSAANAGANAAITVTWYDRYSFFH